MSVLNLAVFGIRTKTVQDEYMKRLYALMEKWSVILELGATPAVDFLPALRIVPQWMLGNWKDRALEVGALMKSLYSTVLGRVQERRVRGIRKDSFMDRILDQQEKNQLSDNQLLFLGGVLMEGGSDTSSSLILTIIQAMVEYPQVQARSLRAFRAFRDLLLILCVGLTRKLMPSLATRGRPGGRTSPNSRTST